MAVDSKRPINVDRRAHRLRQDPHGVPCRARRADPRRPGPRRSTTPTDLCGVHLAPKGAVQRYSNQPASTAARHQRAVARDGAAVGACQHRRTYRRHPAKRPGSHAQARTPHHRDHSGIVVCVAWFRQRPAHARQHPHRDRRRDPRHCRQQTRQPPGLEPGPLAGVVLAAAEADRPVGHAKANQGGVAIPRGQPAPLRHRRHRPRAPPRPGHRSTVGGARRGHGQRRLGAALQPLGRVGARPPHHPGVRQHPPPGRAPDPPPQRPPGAHRGSRASRQPCQRATPGR